MVCKGVCHRYKARWASSQFRYACGQKRCNVCEIFLNWDGISCPCCGMMLRTRPILLPKTILVFNKQTSPLRMDSLNTCRTRH